MSRKRFFFGCALAAASYLYGHRHGHGDGVVAGMVAANEGHTRVLVDLVESRRNG